MKFIREKRNFPAAPLFDTGWKFTFDSRSVMEEISKRAIATVHIRLILLLLWLVPLEAQVTNQLNLCTEGALQSAVDIGGIYQFGNCGSNTLPSITLSAPLVIQRDLTLISTQQVLLTGQSLTRLFVVKPGIRLTLQNILLFSGRHTETNFNDGGYPDTAGAAIYNDAGIVTILSGRFEGNSVVGVTGLAGVDETGEDGEPGGDAAGGAIYNNGGQIVVSNTVFIGNSVTGGPGGKGGTASGVFGGDGGDGGNGGTGAGGAIYSRGGSVMLFSSTFTTNAAVGSAPGVGALGTGLLGFIGTPGEAGEAIGAAVSSDSAELTIYGCTFFGNTVRAANGLPGNAGQRNRDGEQGRNGGDAAGAAIFSIGRVGVTNSTFFANAVIAGAGGAGGAGGGTGFGGSGGNGGDGGSATGGAIETTGGGTIVNCTFSDNTTTPGAGGAGGQQAGTGDAGRAGSTGFSSGGAVYARGETVAIANNILSNSRISVGGNITDRGGNLSTDANVLLTDLNSLKLMNPLLRSLATNGGPTQTMSIATNSPAVNRGVAEFCPAQDQRGTNRVGICDIGAFEITGADTNVPPIFPPEVINGMTISKGTNLVALSWPAGYTNISLQFTANLLLTNTVWSAATGTITTNNGSNVVTFGTANNALPRTFFRLVGRTNSP